MSKQKKNPYRVFVSHATMDKPLAKRICRRLDAIKGVQTFRDDRDIEGGEHIEARIKSALEECDELLVLMTPTSVTRPWVIMEVGIAWYLDKRLVPICYNIDVNVLPLVGAYRAFRYDQFLQHLDEIRKRVAER